MAPKCKFVVEFSEAPKIKEGTKYDSPEAAAMAMYHTAITYSEPGYAKVYLWVLGADEPDETRRGRIRIDLSPLDEDPHRQIMRHLDDPSTCAALGLY